MTTRARFALLLLLGSLSAVPQAATAPATRVAVEVFRVGLTAARGQAIVFSRIEGPLESGENPDRRARGLAGDDPGAVALIHSTSWRWEKDGRIVLTYLAWFKDGRLGRDARPLPPLSPPEPTDPVHPRPAQIRELDPLAHGLRHLAFLLQASRDGAVATTLGPDGVAALRRFEPELAGQLPR